ncbi:MAG: hypothetical protein WC426_13555 [Sulfuriferula sp.]
MEKLDVNKILKKADITKSERGDIDIFTVDLTPAGYAVSVDVAAASESDARIAAKEALEQQIKDGVLLPLVPEPEETETDEES